MKNKILKDLSELISQEKILIDEKMSKHTCFKIGGPADFYIKPTEIEDLKKILPYLKENKIPTIILGNGSNMLVKDNGIRGVVIEIGDSFNKIEINNNKVKAYSGIKLSALSKQILKKELKGFEFANGIPGTLGGAVAMNAGAYGGEMKDVISKVEVIDFEGNLLEFTNQEMEFNYRKSKITNKNLIVVSATLELEKGKFEEIKAQIDDYTNRRRTKQPLEFPSAGSTFKRPKEGYASKLIEDSGLKGLTVGGAKVSEKHSGFIINFDNATAQDVLDLIEKVKEKVNEKFNIQLEEEVKIIGE